MATSSDFRPPKQWQLSEEETISTYANWQSNILYHLSLCNDFSSFLDSNWEKKSVANRGLKNDAGTAGKTGVQKAIILERMLSLIAQFAPSLLRNDIIKNSTSLSWIWERIRKYYAFGSSEVNFIKLYEIKRKDGERYGTLYQRILAHLEDNLITISSGIEHDGLKPTVDEVLSPTAERLAVYHWLTLIDQRLPAYVARTYAQDLQSRSLKDIQPRISENMDAILVDINSQEATSIQYTQSLGRKSNSYSNFTNKKHQAHNTKRNSVNKKPNQSCAICSAAGRPSTGHDISKCWFISKFDKMNIAKACRVMASEDFKSEEESDSDDTNDDVAEQL